MKPILIGMMLSMVCYCHPAPPDSADDVEDEQPTPTHEAATIEGSEQGSPAAETGALAPATTVADELAAVVSAALSGQALPESAIQLPGSRGEQVVTVQGGFPEGAVRVELSMLKVDVTLEGCGDRGGLTLGLLQTRTEVFIVGLGDQFTASTVPSLTGHEDIAALTGAVLSALSERSASELVLEHETCARLFGSAEQCRRVFQEIPDEATLNQYGRMLEGCSATPVEILALVALFFRDEAGHRFQGVARLAERDGRLALTGPIVIAPGLP